MVRRFAALLATAVALWVLWLLFGPTAPGLAHPPVPEDATGFPQCSTCHAPGTDRRGAGVELAPLPPADHAAYARDSCLTCHVSVVGTSPLAASYAQCASCHAATDRAAMLASGERLSVTVDISRYLTSIHGDFSCTECHKTQATIPHAPLTAVGRRQFALEMAGLCQRCHSNTTASYVESFHGRSPSRGAISSPTCADCHTAHYVQKPAPWSASSCVACHPGKTEAFAIGWNGHPDLTPIARTPEPAWPPAPAGPGLGWGPQVLMGWAGIGVSALWWTNRRRKRPPGERHED